MNGFKKQVEADNRSVFMNANEIADTRTIIYDGMTYADIPIVLSGLKEQNRKQLVTTSDHAQGLYLVTSVLYCIAGDLGGVVPEKGQRIKINEEDGGEFFREFHIASSVCEFGMLRIDLEAIDE